MAEENSALIQPNSSATGIWNSPKADRIAKLRSRVANPGRSTGVSSGARDSEGVMRGQDSKPDRPLITLRRQFGTGFSYPHGGLN